MALTTAISAGRFWPKRRCSMRLDDLIRLRHMIDAAREVIGFARGRSREDLNRDRQLV